MLIGYLLLALSMIVGVTKGWCGKKTSNYLSSLPVAALGNALRMALSVLIGFILAVAGGGFSALKLEPGALAICALCGVSTAAFVISWQLSVRIGAYMLADAAGSASCIVPPIICSLLFQGEQIRPIQIPGFVFLLAAVFVMCSYSREIKQKVTPAAIVLLVLTFAGNGVMDLSSKLFVRYYPDASISAFNVYSYFITALGLLGLFAVSMKKQKAQEAAEGAETAVLEERHARQRSDFLHVVPFSVALGALMFAHTFLRTKAAVYVPASQMYPLTAGMALVLSSVMAAVCFHEKPTWRSIVGVIMIFAGLLFLNVL